jgi:hypothetical protein
VWWPPGETGKSVSQYAAEWLKTVPLVRDTIKGSKGLSNVLVSDSHQQAARIASVGLIHDLCVSHVTLAAIKLKETELSG